MNKSTQITKRIVALFIVAALALTAAFALSGCMSKEQQAEDALKAILDDYANGSAEALDEAEIQEFTNMGLDADELVSTMTEDFSYEIKGSTEDSSSDTINVEVTIRAKQITEAVKNSLSNMLSYALGAALSGATESEMQQQMTNMIVDQLKNETPVESTITVPMIEDSGEWVPTAAGEQELSVAVLGDVQSLQSDLNAALSDFSA